MIENPLVQGGTYRPLVRTITESFMRKPPFGPPRGTDRSLTVRLVRESALTSGFLVLFLVPMAGSFQLRRASTAATRCPFQHAPCQPGVAECAENPER